MQDFLTQSFITLPKRTIKPRASGMTMLIDNGVPLRKFADVVESSHEYIDYIKLGWCTSLISRSAAEKVKIAQSAGIDVYLGGTFFEKSLYQKKLREFAAFNKNLGCKIVEVSNGTIDLENKDKSKYIRELAQDFIVISEVGYKDEIRSRDMPPVRWIEYIKQDLDAGAKYVITEARESGKSGICRDNGELRYGLISEMLASDLPIDRIVFEAPNKGLQEYFVKAVGTNVSLGNIAFDDVIGLETLRLGLRSDTLLLFEESGADEKR